MGACTGPMSVVELRGEFHGRRPLPAAGWTHPSTRKSGVPLNRPFFTEGGTTLAGGPPRGPRGRCRGRVEISMSPPKLSEYCAWARSRICQNVIGSRAADGATTMLFFCYFYYLRTLGSDTCEVL